jgi:hypothetical protein
MMPNFSQISRVVSLVLGGMVLTAFVNLPVWALPLIVFDSPLTLRLSGPWLIAAVLVILVCAGTDILLQSQPATAKKGVRHAALPWILPGVIAAAGPLLITNFEPLSTRWFLVLIGVGVGLTLALLAEFYVAAPDKQSPMVRISLTMLIYAAAMLMFTAIYSTHVRTALSGAATSLISFWLALSLFRWPAGQNRVRWRHAVPVGLVMLFVTWMLNHMSLNALAGGGMLLLVFYLITGVIQQFIQDHLNRRVLVEFAVAAVLGLLLLIGFGLR